MSRKINRAHRGIIRKILVARRQKEKKGIVPAKKITSINQKKTIIRMGDNIISFQENKEGTEGNPEQNFGCSQTKGNKRTKYIKIKI